MAEARGPAGLPSEIWAEISQTSHHGKAPVVRDQILEAIAAFEREEYADAFARASVAKGEAPRSASVRELLGLAAYRLGRWRDAQRELQTYRRLSGRRDHDPEIADCERALGRPERAVEILADLDAEEVGEQVWVEGLIVSAGALLDLGRPREAVQRLGRGPVDAKVVHGHHLRLWYALADALEKAGQRAKARAVWDLVYAEDPEFFDVAARRLGRSAR